MIQVAIKLLLLWLHVIVCVLQMCCNSVLFMAYLQSLGPCSWRYSVLSGCVYLPSALRYLRSYFEAVL